MKSIINGNIKHLPGTIKFLKDQKASFVTRESGSSCKIEYTDSEYGAKFSGGSLCGAHLINMVKHDIDQYLKKKTAPKVPFKVYGVVKFNPDLIENNIGFPMTAIDCDHFYWKIAFIKGFISENTYKNGISKSKYKEGRLAALGCLNKMEYIKTYVSGELVGKGEFDMNKFHRYSPFWESIILEAWKLMEDVFETFPNNTCMWLTDCAYINVDAEKKIRKHINEKGYTTKSFPIVFENIDQANKAVRWFDGKANKSKQISYTSYEVETTKLMVISNRTSINDAIT